jgi:hypothetical protein
VLDGGLTYTQRAELGAALGLHLGEIHKRADRHGRVHLDQQYNLDAAIAHAETHGLRYVEAVDTVYDSADPPTEEDK